MTQLAAPYVTIEKAAEITGYTKRAIEAKIARGVWLEGSVWVHAPDGRRLVSLKGYQQWVEQGRPGELYCKQRPKNRVVG